ncbi:MAG: hypothetical protein VKL39_23275 [Leptolyngbyaceae bacterium]|nr:hypothetical protein [Leptolyngbyaceae bacterium]
MNHYELWFKRVVLFGVLANWTFSLVALTAPDTLLSTLNLGTVESTVWLTNYSFLLILLSCFYIPAALNPRRYIVNSWLLIASRLIPATTFFVGTFIGDMPKGFVTLGLGDFSIGCIEGILLILLLRKETLEADTSSKPLTVAK